KDSRSLRIVKRFLARSVPRQKELAAPLVPDREREHPTKAAHARFAFFFIQVNDDLSVRLGAEPVSPRLQPRPELLEVVDLSVEHDPDGPVLMGQRLPAHR